jgi:hypothetical protein
MKKILLSIIALCCSMMAGAQTTDQISAILQNGEETTVFYGASALKNAIAAAPNSGGVITLTSGLFNATDIIKDVKIFGSGFQTIDSLDVAMTNINGGFNVNLPTDIAGPHGISMEGIYVNGDITVKSAVDGFSLTKCSFSQLTFQAAATRCVVTQSYIRYAINGGYDLYVQNSYVNGHSINVLNDESNILLNHCIITDGYNFDGRNSRFNCTNCIVNVGYRNSIQTYNYCILPNINNLNGFVDSGNNWFSIGEANVFKDASNFNYTDDRTFELKNPDTYIGNDNTQVGIHGGIFPWNKVPSTPVVKNLNATVDGINLNVEYEAEVR